MSNKQEAEQQQQHQQQVQTQTVAPKKQDALQVLNKVGGFNFVETVVDGIANMNPTRKARKEIFLNDSSKKTERKDLLKKLNLWISLLENHSTAEEMADTCRTRLQVPNKI